jgi:quinol monooxygenase YgiN
MRLHNLVQKVPLVLVILLLLGTNSFAAPQVSGPDNVEPGDLVRIMITEISDLNDPKFQCVPPNDKWVAVKSFDNQAMIIFSTKTPGTYTFGLAGNKDNKTYLILKQVIVGVLPEPLPPNPPPPVPPTPNPGGKYTTILSAPYMVSPDNDSLIKLISVYKSMAAQAKSISNYSQMMAALVASTKDTLTSETKLRGVRDAVADILQNDLANRNSIAYDAAKTEAIFNELANSLKALVK